MATGHATPASDSLNSISDIFLKNMSANMIKGAAGIGSMAVAVVAVGGIALAGKGLGLVGKILKYAGKKASVLAKDHREASCQIKTAEMNELDAKIKGSSARLREIGKRLDDPAIGREEKTALYAELADIRAEHEKHVKALGGMNKEGISPLKPTNLWNGQHMFYNQNVLKLHNMENELDEVRELLDKHGEKTGRNDAARETADGPNPSVVYDRARLVNELNIIENHIVHDDEQIIEITSNIKQVDTPRMARDAIAQIDRAVADLREQNGKLDAMAESAENEPREKIKIDDLKIKLGDKIEKLHVLKEEATEKLVDTTLKSVEKHSITIESEAKKINTFLKKIDKADKHEVSKNMGYNARMLKDINNQERTLQEMEKHCTDDIDRSDLVEKWLGYCKLKKEQLEPQQKTFVEAMKKIEASEQPQAGPPSQEERASYTEMGDKTYGMSKEDTEAIKGQLTIEDVDKDGGKIDAGLDNPENSR